MKTLHTLDDIFTGAVGLVEEVDSGQDPALDAKERAKAVRNVRSYVKQFKRAGLVVRLFDADNQQIAPGEGTVAFVLVHAKFMPTLADAAALVARGGRLKEDPLQRAFLAWRVAEPPGPEDALVKTAQEILSEPRKGKSRSKPADSKKR